MTLQLADQHICHHRVTSVDGWDAVSPGYGQVWPNHLWPKPSLAKTKFGQNQVWPKPSLALPRSACWASWADALPMIQEAFWTEFTVGWCLHGELWPQGWQGWKHEAASRVEEEWLRGGSTKRPVGLKKSFARRCSPICHPAVKRCFSEWSRSRCSFLRDPTVEAHADRTSLVSGAAPTAPPPVAGRKKRKRDKKQHRGQNQKQFFVCSVLCFFQCFSFVFLLFFFLFSFPFLVLLFIRASIASRFL